MHRAFMAPLLAVAAAIAPAADPSDAVRHQIESWYTKALDALQHARTLGDLDEINRSFDTADWESISPGQQPRTWADLRKYGFEGLWSPFQSAEFVIDSFEVNGDTAVAKGHLRTVNMKGGSGSIPLKETFRKTAAGWKRSIHQKFRPGEVPQ